MLLRIALILVAGLSAAQNTTKPDFEHRSVRTENGQLHVAEIGSGRPAVIFVPSLAGTWEQFADAASVVAKTHRAVIIEPRGHGESDAPRDGDYSIEGYASDIAAVAGARQVEDSILVGHSLGAGIALAYAAAHPKSVRALFLVDPMGDSSKTPGAAAPFIAALEKDYERTIGDYWRVILKGANDVVTAKVIAAMLKTPRTTVIQSIKASGRFEAVKRAGEFGGPIVSVISEINNSPTALHVLLPAIQVHRLQGVSHWLQLDRPEEFNSLLHATLERYAGR